MKESSVCVSFMSESGQEDFPNHGTQTHSPSKSSLRFRQGRTVLKQELLTTLIAWTDNK